MSAFQPSPPTLPPAAPLPAPADPGPPLIEPGYHRAHRVRLAPLVGGAVTFGVSYGLSVLAAGARYVARSNPDTGTGSSEGALLLPVIGPFWQAAQPTGPSSDTVRGLGLSTASLLVLDGLVQGVSLGFLIYGAASRKTVLVRDTDASVAIVPLFVGNGSTGLGFVGRF